MRGGSGEGGWCEDGGGGWGCSKMRVLLGATRCRQHPYGKELGRDGRREPARAAGSGAGWGL